MRKIAASGSNESSSLQYQAFERRQVFAGHTRNGELHGHAAFALANALDLKLAQVLLS